LTVPQEMFSCDQNAHKAPSFLQRPAFQQLKICELDVHKKVASKAASSKGRAETYPYTHCNIHTRALNEEIVLASNKTILEISLTCLFFKKFNKGVVFLAREYTKQT